MTTPVELDDGLNQRVVQLAGAQRRSAQSVIRDAIQQYVDRQEARESFRQEALASWSSYQETGRHVPGEEARGWFASWGTDDEMAPPECRGSS